MTLPKFYSLYSGGKDSTVCTAVLQESGMLAGVVTIRTGIAAPDWEPFIVQSCKDHGWPLEIFETQESYDDLVRKYGFPGPGMHGTYMNYLKGRGIREFKKVHPEGALASGVRKSESARRFRGTKEWSVFEGVPVYAPIMHWTTEQVWDYFNSHGFERSPAYATLCISGDCLCGAFAGPEERAIIQAVYPEVDARFKRLESETGGTWGKFCRKKLGRKTSILCTDCERAGEPL